MNFKNISLFLAIGLVIALGFIVEEVYGGLNISLGGIVALVQLILTYVVIKGKK